MNTNDVLMRSAVRLLTCLFVCLLVAPLTGGAAELYVGTAGMYNGAPGAYTSLQAAIDAAAPGDTVWVDDGFVCDTGETVTANNASRININKAITVRSRSGNLVNPPVIRGAWHDPITEVRFGVDAVRCVEMTAAGALLTGFRLEGGSTADGTAGDAAALAGGGFLGFGTLSNCVVTGNSAIGGGGVKQGSTILLLVTHCIVSNNTAKIEGGGIMRGTIVSSRIVNNVSDGASGGFRDGTFTNCLIAGNTAAGAGGGGLSLGGTFVDCVFSNNVAGGNGGGVHYTPKLSNCLFIGNQAGGTGGGVNGVAKTSRAHIQNCTFVSNSAANHGGGAANVTGANNLFSGNQTIGNGGGVYSGILTNCVLTANSASYMSGWVTGCGGGASDSTLVSCWISENRAIGQEPSTFGHGLGGGLNGSTAIGCVVSNNVSGSRGGGSYGGTGYNNLVVGNLSEAKGGGGVYLGTHYNTLIISNTAVGNGGGAGYLTTLFNCTVVGNTATSKAGLDYCRIENTISWANIGGADIVQTATNSCSTALTGAHGPGNITSDPRLTMGGEFPYVPMLGSPCMNSGLNAAWMTDYTDERSHDRYGRRRIVGSVVDMGAFEALGAIQTLIVR